MSFITLHEKQIHKPKLHSWQQSDTSDPLFTLENEPLQV